MLRVLRFRNVALLWIGGLVSAIGDLVLFIALPYFIYTVTGSTLATGSMFLAEALPRLFLGSLAGVFVDRWDRRWTMIVADLARATTLPAVILAQSGQSLWIVYVVAFVQSVFGIFFNPAQNAIIPGLVSEHDLDATNALTSTSNNLAMLAGPTLGGVALTLLGLSGAVLVDSASFLFSALMIFFIRPSVAFVEVARPSGAEPATADAGRAFLRVWEEWIGGLRVVGQSPLLTALFVVVALGMLAQGIVNTLLVAFVRDVLHGDATTFGLLPTAQGVGGVIGALAYGQLGSAVPAPRTVKVGYVSIGILVVGIVNAPTLPIVLGLVALVGVPSMALGVAIQTLLQTTVADEFRGRVFGAWGTNTSLMMILGIGIAGVLGNPLGISPMLDVAGALWFFAGVVAAVLMRKSIQVIRVGEPSARAGAGAK